MINFGKLPVDGLYRFFLKTMLELRLCFQQETLISRNKHKMLTLDGREKKRLLSLLAEEEVASCFYEMEEKKRLGS